MTGNKPWAELVQLVPIVSLALPFILSGEVDLNRAGTAFIVAALLTVPISGLVLKAGQPLNPILVGTALWLWIGAAAFNAPIPPLARWLAETQGFGLFLAAGCVGVVMTFATATGYLGCNGVFGPVAHRFSLVLLGFTLVCMGWAWWFRHDIRLGGGLPFIVLNVMRRVLCVRVARN